LAWRLALLTAHAPAGGSEKKQVSLSGERWREQEKETGGFHCSAWLKRIGLKIMISIIGTFIY
jgi:hypothetical protein